MDTFEQDMDRALLKKNRGSIRVPERELGNENLMRVS